MTFNYTHGETDLNSTAVAEAYYNAPERQLAVVLQSGHGYVYDRVPLGTYDALVSSSSPGRVYATTVKRHYGPGESLGYVGWDSDEFVKGYEAPSMAAVGTPKNLYYSVEDLHDSSRLGSSSGSSVRFDLGPVEVPETKKHTIAFEANGAERSHTMDASSVDGAVESLQEIADMLGVEFRVKAVTVHFE